MIGVKDLDMPEECWGCSLTFEDRGGYTTCFLTQDRLYPVGARTTRPDDCPLVELPDSIQN